MFAKNTGLFLNCPWIFLFEHIKVNVFDMRFVKEIQNIKL